MPPLLHLSQNNRSDRHPKPLDTVLPQPATSVNCRLCSNALKTIVQNILLLYRDRLVQTASKQRQTNAAYDNARNNDDPLDCLISHT